MYAKHILKIANTRPLRDLAGGIKILLIFSLLGWNELESLVKSWFDVNNKKRSNAQYIAICCMVFPISHIVSNRILQYQYFCTPRFQFKQVCNLYVMHLLVPFIRAGINSSLNRYMYVML